MPSLDVVATFILVTFFLSITPGPSILYIIARSVSQGAQAGVSAAGGMAVGSFIYVLATVFGIATIFQYSPFAYTLVKAVGAVYLIYLGWQYLTAEPLDTEGEQQLSRMSNGKILKQSVIVELTNPKTALFFLAFLPQFVEVEKGSLGLQLFVLGVIYALVTLMCDVSIAFLSGRLGNWLNGHSKAVKLQDRIAGTMLVSLGVFLGIETARS